MSLTGSGIAPLTWEDKRSAAAAPDAEVVDKPTRRRFSPSYKLRVVEEADRCTEPGEVGRLLRREGLYSSHLTTWRKAVRSGWLRALSKRRGRKPSERNPLEGKVRKLERENTRPGEGTGVSSSAWVQESELLFHALHKEFDHPDGLLLLGSEREVIIQRHKASSVVCAALCLAVSAVILLSDSPRPTPSRAASHAATSVRAPCRDQRSPRSSRTTRLPSRPRAGR